MGNYENLKQSITEVIRTNGNQEITGSVLQSTLLTIISTVGANATFAGIATPATNPGTPDGSVFYLASESGTYSNFGSIELQDGLSVLMWNGSWSGQQIFGVDDEPTAGSDNLVKSGGVQEELALGAVYDVSAKNPTAGVNNDGKWESLSALLSDTNLSTLIPTTARKGGMSIKFVQSSDNKYVQYILMTDEFTTDTTQWAIAEEGVHIENNEFIYVKTDAEDRILWAIKTDGGIYYGTGVPQQVKDYIDEKLAELSLDEYEDIVAFLNDLEKGDKTLQTLLNEKVDKEAGKSLANNDIVQRVFFSESNDWMKVITDNSGLLIGGVKKDGSIDWSFGIPTPIKNRADIDNVESATLVFALCDKDNKILFGVDKDGKCQFEKKNEDAEKIKIICWGDSLTAGAGSADITGWSSFCQNLVSMGYPDFSTYTSMTYETMIQNLIGESYNVVNCGVGGENILTIAARLGSELAYIPSDMVLPADGSIVDIVRETNASLPSQFKEGGKVRPLIQGDGGSVNPVFINGTPCTLSIDTPVNYQTAAYKIKRVQAGTINLDIKAGTPIIMYGSSVKMGAEISILWCWQNGGYANDNELIELLKNMTASIPNSKYIIVGLHSGTASSRAEQEALLQKTFGDKFFNWRLYVSSAALQEFGITPTQEDTAAMAVGSCPPSLLYDAIHLNAVGYSILGINLYNKIKMLNY